MRRLALTVLLVLLVVAVSTAQAATPSQLLRDFNRTGALTGSYSSGDLQHALADQHLLPLARKLGGGRAELVLFRQAVASELEARAPLPAPPDAAHGAGLQTRTLIEKLGVAAMLFGIALALFVIGWGLLAPPQGGHRGHRTSLS